MYDPDELRELAVLGPSVSVPSDQLLEILDEIERLPGRVERSILTEERPLCARKVGGNYAADGWVLARFRTRTGKRRVVFEFRDVPGLLHIFREDQVQVE